MISNNIKPEIRVTDDGSHTLFNPNIEECYHSHHGSIQEAELVFIQYGLLDRGLKQIRLLEIGFGTGLNAYLSLLAGKREKISIEYTTIELYPITLEQAMQLNFVEKVPEGDQKAFGKLHQCEWGSPQQINENFTLTKLHADFTTFIPDNTFDVIYFDAFSPDKQQEMWQEKLFKKLYLCAEDNAHITTYSTKGVVRRRLSAVGFDVEKLPGPVGKREVLRGIKKNKNL